MGKEIPKIEMPKSASKEDKILAENNVSLAKVNFVAGARSSLNTTDEDQEASNATQDTPDTSEARKIFFFPRELMYVFHLRYTVGWEIFVWKLNALYLLGKQR